MYTLNHWKRDGETDYACVIMDSISVEYRLLSVLK